MTVAIKRAPKGTAEVQIGRFFHSPELRSNPENHCVPILDTFPHPHRDDVVFVVMPLLRRWDDPLLQTVGEMMDTMLQLLEVSFSIPVLPHAESSFPTGLSFHALPSRCS